MSYVGHCDAAWFEAGPISCQYPTAREVRENRTWSRVLRDFGPASVLQPTVALAFLRGLRVDWNAKLDLFEQLRREHEYGVGTTAGVAAKFRVHRAS